MHFLTKFFGDGNARAVKKIQPIVDQVNSFEPSMRALSDEELKNKTEEFKQRLAKGETLDDILPEAFAVVREASSRAIGLRHYDVQLVGGVVLHHGQIAEMRTGEGKTLVATLPVYLNALEGKGVHVVTVNDYLAKRDAVWMGKIYDFLGLSVGVVQNLRVSFIYDSTRVAPVQDINADSGKAKISEIESFKIEDEYLRSCSRQDAYRCDITYGTNNEFGFDYLRDNMVQDLSEMVMRPGSEMRYAIVDEVDSILIDEARTPLIISAPAEEATEQYYEFARLVRQLVVNEDYNVDEKLRSATLTDQGIVKFEQWLGIGNIYEEGGIRVVHHIEQALKAEVLFKRDRDYIVDAGEIIIIDEFTGRKMPGRRYSEGLHQALEAKENLSIQRESQTLATITFQNLFRMYDKLAGMTGTAATEAEEFFKIYGLEVVVAPTNKPDQRFDNPDRIYKTEAGKFHAVAEKIKECRAKNQPILVGTISVEKNERLSEYLNSLGVPHEILNAKNHEREGQIIAQAGRPGAVTLATNMAGRGVDIKLGGALASQGDIEKVIQSGGLFVLGTERHESRRIDNQLRGRSARQGDPGQTQFFVSTEDDLMRIFAGERLKNVMTRLNVPDEMPIEQKLITRMLETAQKKVESHNFDIRKHLLEYDDVLNKQRSVIYAKRRRVLELSQQGLTSKSEAETLNEEYALSPELGNKSAPLSPEQDQNSQDQNQNEDRDRARVFSENVHTSLRGMIMSMIESEIEVVVSYHTSPEAGDWDVNEIYETMRTIFPFTDTEKRDLLSLSERGNGNMEDIAARDRLVNYLFAKAKAQYACLIEQVKEQMPVKNAVDQMVENIEKSLLLRAIDTFWVDHLVAIDYLRAGIGLQGYGQRDPLIEYKKQSFIMFNQLLADIQKEVVYSFFKLNIGFELAPTIMASDKLTLQGASNMTDNAVGRESQKPRNADGQKVGRNDPCPCGSGKKYKRCHGA